MDDIDNSKQLGKFGGVCVDVETFKTAALEFVDAYKEHWGIKVDDDSAWARKG